MRDSGSQGNADDAHGPPAGAFGVKAKAPSRGTRGKHATTRSPLEMHQRPGIAEATVPLNLHKAMKGVAPVPERASRVITED
jgi:hypothetical protein